ncbi:MAG TPA: hypothetical protein VLJ17_09320, partial [Xanthobacteraceae bacterium]|nr:hypothetical protein [Xanthobacteraceae bacterium]
MAGPERWGSFPHREDRISRLGGAPGGVVSRPTNDAYDLYSIGGEPHVSLQVDDLESEDLAELLRPDEKCHAVRG